jgi:beta-glucosidase
MLLAAAAMAATVMAADPIPRGSVYLDPRAPLESRVTDLLVRLTLDEKITLMAGESAFATASIPRLGIPSLRVSDGPSGVRSNEGRPATVFPTGSALAATWHPTVVQAVGEAIGREALAMNIQVILGPDVNIQRVPLAGRNFEAYSEDPYLSGRIGIAAVQGIQKEGVGTSVKHFVCNEQELERLRSSSNVDQQTLHEIYLRPFEMIVEEAHPWTVMASYNRVNGTYMTEHRPLIRDVLDGEWGFDGVVISDWGAMHTATAAANAGLDLEMPGPPRFFGSFLKSSLSDWRVDPGAVDDAARRMVRLIIRSGLLDGRQRPAGELLSSRNRQAALAAARESIVLLKNERGLLPLDRAHIRTLAVIGPGADIPLYGGGGSSRVIPATVQTPLVSLRGIAGAHIDVRYARGADNHEIPPPIDPRLLSASAPGSRGKAQQGLAYSYYANEGFQGNPVQSGIESDFYKVGFAPSLTQMSARWEGFLEAPESGVYQLSLSGFGQVTLELDGQLLIGNGRGRTVPPLVDFGTPLQLATVSLEAGHRYAVRVEYSSVGPPSTFHSMQLGLRLPEPSFDDAVAAARSADVAIVLVGSSRSSETEGRDRLSLALGGRQNELVEAVLAANPRTIVVLQSGSPYELPWADKAPAILEGWLNGEEGPQALAEIIFGTENPSGKLPFTFPRRLLDNPTYLYYPATRDVSYGEGVFVGYRWYDKRQIEPLFAFGHGLSYTSFAYSNLRLPASLMMGSSIDLAVDVRNTGLRAGQETVQVYVGDGATLGLVRPVKELRAFEKVQLAPGETKTVRFTLSPRDLSYYDAHQGIWVSSPGTHHIFVGSSSRDIRLQQELQWMLPRS